MRFGIDCIGDITRCFTNGKKKEPGIAKTAFKAVAVTVAVLAVVPTVFVKREDGFDMYGILSRVGYKKTVNENGEKSHNVALTLVDLSRYGVCTNKENVEE